MPARAGHGDATRLDEAAAACARDGVRLTDLRREVLGLVLTSESPATAYQLLDRLRERRGGTATPPTIYRALDFLLANGLVHRIERLNAFVACVEEDGHAHQAQFLICERCGTVTELEDDGIGAALERVAGRHGFQVRRRTIELEGLCAACAAPGPK